MKRKIWSSLLGLGGVVASTTAFACGQMAPIGPTKPGAMILVRGYGFGFEGGVRPVTLVWSTGGEIAGTAYIDATGNFAAEIIAPSHPGEYSLIVREGDADPTPATVTVPVTSEGA